MQAGTSPIELKRVSKLSVAMLAKADFSITVRQEALPPFEGPNLANVQFVAPYEKKYPCDEALFEKAMATKRMIATADLSGDSASAIESRALCVGKRRRSKKHI